MCDDEFGWVADPDVIDPRVADWISDIDFAKAEEDRRLLGKVMALTARVHELEQRVDELSARDGAVAARRVHYPEAVGSIPTPATYSADQERIGG